MYHFTYVLSEKDYWELNKFHLLYSKSGKRSINLMRLTVPMILLAFILLSDVWEVEFNTILLEIIIFTIGSIVWLFAAKPVVLFRAKRHIATMKKDGKLPFEKNVSLQFDEDFVIGTTERGESKIRYTAIEKTCVGSDAIYIYTNAVQAHIIPLYVFESQEQISGFLAFIKNKAG